MTRYQAAVMDSQGGVAGNSNVASPKRRGTTESVSEAELHGKPFFKNKVGSSAVGGRQHRRCHPLLLAHLEPKLPGGFHGQQPCERAEAEAYLRPWPRAARCQHTQGSAGTPAPARAANPLNCPAPGPQQPRTRPAPARSPREMRTDSCES